MDTLPATASGSCFYGYLTIINYTLERSHSKPLCPQVSIVRVFRHSIAKITKTMIISVWHITIFIYFILW